MIGENNNSKIVNVVCRFGKKNEIVIFQPDWFPSPVTRIYVSVRIAPGVTIKY